MSDSKDKRAAAIAAAIAGAIGLSVDAEAKRRHAASDGDWEPRLDQETIRDRMTERVGGDAGSANIWDDWFNDPSNGGGGGNGGNGGGGGNLNWFPFS